MAKRGCTVDKIRLLAVYRMIMRGRKITRRQIMDELELRYDIVVDRKTIYDDIRCIDKIVPVMSTTGRYGGYQLWDVFFWGGVEDG